MAKSLYQNVPIVDDHHQETYSLPVKAMGLVETDLLKGVRTVEYTLKAYDRPDNLASRFFGDEGYWYVILMANGINYPFPSGGWYAGRVIRIPVDVGDVVAKILK